MAWVRLDDHVDEHPKVARAEAVVGDAGFAAMVKAIAYSNRNLTDGFIPATAVRCLTLHRKPAAVAQALVLAGLWEEAEGGYRIHDYDKYQDSRETIKAKRQKTAEKVAGHRQRKRSVTPDVTGYSDVTDGLVTPLAGVTRGVGLGYQPQTGEEPEPIDARAPGGWRDALASLGDGPVADRLRETVEILATSRRLTLDPELVGVANMLAAHPEGDHRRAAHMAVAAAADPAYRATVAARALGYAFDELARAAARMPASSVDEKQATADRRAQAALEVYGEGRAA